MRSWIAIVFMLLTLTAGCTVWVPADPVPEPVTRHLSMERSCAVPYDVLTTTPLGKFLVKEKYFIAWTSDDGPISIFGRDIRLSSYTTLPNGTNVPYTLSGKARSLMDESTLRIATYSTGKILSIAKHKSSRKKQETRERYRAKIQVRIEPLLTNMPSVPDVIRTVDIEYDPASEKVLRSDLGKTMPAVRKAIEKVLKKG